MLIWILAALIAGLVITVFGLLFSLRDHKVQVDTLKSQRASRVGMALQDNYTNVFYKKLYNDKAKEFSKLKEKYLNLSHCRNAQQQLSTHDMSPAMVGKTVRIVKEGVVGTHDFIQGTLQSFDFNTECSAYLSGSDVIATDINATVAGIDMNLNGSEQLIVLGE